MPKELIAESRLRTEQDTLANAYGAGANVVIGELTGRWSKGFGPPHDDVRIQNVHVHDKDGNHIGFRFYLVWNEPLVMGPTKVEVAEE